MLSKLFFGSVVGAESCLSRAAAVLRNSLYTCNHYTTSSPDPSSSQDDDSPPNKVVFISQSTDVFSNLALESWLYRNFCFNRRHLLLLWRNSPCVVIGRHQNPFKEANLPYLESAQVPLARRASGGGAVYHDMGNLNCTFFTPRDRYSRRWNLEVLCKALTEGFDLDVSLNSRDDILLNGTLKVSGSAAKLGPITAYHHCSLLVNTDHTQLSLALKGDKNMCCRATESVLSSVGNLGGSAEGMSVERAIHTIATRYLQAPCKRDQGHDPSENMRASHGMTLVNPKDDWFPGLGEIRSELMSWEWKFGKTPRFAKQFTLRLPEGLRQEGVSAVQVNVKCQHGRVKEVTLDDASSSAVSEELRAVVNGELNQGLRDTVYSAQLPSVMDMLLQVPRQRDGAASSRH